MEVESCSQEVMQKEPTPWIMLGGSLELNIGIAVSGYGGFIALRSGSGDVFVGTG